MQISLKDAFRWIERDGKMVLQVLSIQKKDLDNETQQYVAVEVWNDVPVVVEKIDANG